MNSKILTVAKVKEMVLQSMNEQDRATKVYYIDEIVNESGAKLIIDDKEHLLSSDKIVVFVDEEPGKNWGHDCHYQLYDVHSGEVEKLCSRFPPSIMKDRTTYKMIWAPTDIPKWALWS
jgi:hypothetical protein